MAREDRDDPTEATAATGRRGAVSVPEVAEVVADALLCLYEARISDLTPDEQQAISTVRSLCADVEDGRR